MTPYPGAPDNAPAKAAAKMINVSKYNGRRTETAWPFSEKMIPYFNGCTFGENMSKYERGKGWERRITRSCD